MITYSYKDALQKSTEYFNGEDLPARVFLDKYALRDSKGNLLEDTPDKMHRRLSKEFARIEKKYPNPMLEDEIFDLIDNFKYIIPQGSPMSAIGNPHHVQSSGNCFTIEPPYDSYGGIFYTDQQLGQLMKRRCGVGLDLSNLRPKGMSVQNAARTTDGIAVFMERYSNTCREVAQNGRRGAEIQLLNVHHPEVNVFMTIKKDRKKVTGANISLKFTDEFMDAVIKDEEFELRWPVNSKDPIISEKVSAKEIWGLFIESSWESSEPGALFWSTILRNSSSNIYGEVDEKFYDTACNPCGEIVMGTDSCRLMAINLYNFIENKFQKDAYFNFDKFAIYVQKAQRLMDDMVDLEIELVEKILEKIEKDPEPDNIKEIEKDTWRGILEVCKKGRRTGLGITGLADALASLNIKYGDSKSIKVTEKIYKALEINAYKSTCTMAKERGAFPIFSFDIEKGSAFINKVVNSDEDVKEIYSKHGRRNVALTTTPPAGSISILAQVSSGIEPVFSIKNIRRKKIHEGDSSSKVDFVDDMGDKWQEFVVCHKGFDDWKKETNKNDVKDSPYYQATAQDIDWEASVDIQAAAQKWVCHSISKTCNIPNDATKELVEKIYLRAYEKGCKGFTIYRDGSRTGVLIDDTKQKQEEKNNSIIKTNAPKRPKELPGDLHHVTVKGKKYFVLVGVLNGNDPYEIFAGCKDISNLPKQVIIKRKKRNTYCILDVKTEDVLFDDISKNINDEEEALTRMISLGLRHGSDINFITHQLEKTSGDMLGFSKAVSRVLKKYIKDGSMVHGESCPECGGKLRRIEGCISCTCGFSKCG